MKIIALDIGDAWTGSAISDPMGIVARPLQTIETTKLFSFVRDLLSKETISKIIIGHPRTLRGTVSEQTKKVEEVKGKLDKLFPKVQFILWDERLSSKRADTLKHAKTKEEKIKSHSIAAAFILENYLQSLAFAKTITEEEK